MEPQNFEHIASAVAECASAYPVREAYLFGSCARGEDDASSDIDLCVESDRGFTLFMLSDLAEKLEAALGRPVDIVCGAQSFYPRAKDRYLRDRIRVYAKS